MTFKVDERIRETSTTTGTGTYTLDGPVTGFQAASVLGANNYGPFFITDDTDWEAIISQVLTGPNRLTRDAVKASSNGGAAVNWAAGTRKVRCGWPAWLALDDSLSLSVAGSADVTLTQQQMRKKFLKFTGVLTGNINVIVDDTKWDWIVDNSTTGDFTLTLKVSGQTGIVVQQGTKSTMFCDGTDVRTALGGLQTLFVPASAMLSRVTNGPSSGVVETATNKVNLRTLDFDATTQEFAQFAVKMPKGWDEGTVKARFVWKHAATTTNFGVVWNCAGLARSDNDAADTAFGTAQQVADTGGTTNNVYITGLTPAITIGGTPAEGDTVWFQIARVPADGSDTLAIDAGLLGVEIAYTVNNLSDA